MAMNAPNAHTNRPTWHRTACCSLTLASALLWSGCSTFQEDRIDYTSAKRGPGLEVPPDLTQLSRENRYVVPGTVVSASGYSASVPTQTVTTGASAVGDVRIERAGTQRWLVVSRPADQLWQPVRDFWQENGFVFTVEQKNLGLLETDWAENRAKIPEDVIRRTLGKLMDNLYSTGERDRFRTRLERNAQGETEIYISHRGMVEVYADQSKDRTVWQPRPADPELEAEFLRRLMLKLGVTQDAAKAQLAAGVAQPKARIVAVAGSQEVLEVDEVFDRAWRRLGLALDRTGFTVEDRDRSQGVYFVRYVEPVPAQQEPGMLSKLFGASKTESRPEQYRIQLSGTGSPVTVRVLNARAEADGSPAAQRILRLLLDDLK
jgi:outer membrane protein assembly factor BamC